MGPSPQRVNKFDNWNQRNKADRLEHFRSLCSGRRLRSLFVETLQWTGIGRSQRRHSPEPANRVGRFESSRPVVQWQRLCWRQFADLWHADRFPAELADLRWCTRLRSDGRLLRLLAHRLAGNNLRRRQYRKLQAHDVAEI